MSEAERAERFRKARTKHRAAQTREEALYWEAMGAKSALADLVKARTGYRDGAPELLAELERVIDGGKA
ncbi:hypothetical protein [Mycetocola saprophilus]|uniref:hypothetical protein n=1 Tax=Mycetocola saprophilus TaxID=76636 RepID=UPI0004C11FF2|nr:hypothetical protein [Mycetocola saprophilus]